MIICAYFTSANKDLKKKSTIETGLRSRTVDMHVNLNIFIISHCKCGKQDSAEIFSPTRWKNRCCCYCCCCGIDVKKKIPANLILSKSSG